MKNATKVSPNWSQARRNKHQADQRKRHGDWMGKLNRAMWWKKNRNNLFSHAGM